MIDPGRCMILKDGEPLGGRRCQAPATHDSLFGRCCDHHAEELRRRLRNPTTFANRLYGRPRTEAEIVDLVKALPS